MSPPPPLPLDKGKRRWTAGEQRRDSTRSIPIFFQHNQNESTIEMQTSLSGSPLRSDGVDETGDANRTLVWVARYQTRWTDDDWVDPDSCTQKMEQPAGRKRRAGGRSAVNRIPEETVVHKDSRWDIPRKRALFMSDGPDSTTSGSDIPESHASGSRVFRKTDIQTTTR